MHRYSSPYHLWLILLVAAAVLSSCVAPGGQESDAAEAYRFTRFAMDTVVDYTILAPSRETAFAAMLDAHQEVERVELLLWEKHADSAIHALNEDYDLERLPDEVVAFVNRLRAYHRRTAGRFDPSIGAVLDLYAFGTDDPHVPDAAELDSVLSRTGMDRFPVDREARLAVGGVAKGYAVDRAVAVLRRHRIRNALVNAGGDLFALGSNDGRPWRIGVTHPGNPGALIDTLYVTDAAVATSGDYELSFEHDGIRYHHLIDPATGMPARLVRSATVIAPTAEEADALATGLFVAGPSEGRKMLDPLETVSGMVIDSSFQPSRFEGFDRYRAAAGVPAVRARPR